MFFLVERSAQFHGSVAASSKVYQSHSSLKSYTEYWLPPEWLPRRDVDELAGECRRGLLVGGCEEVEEDEDEADGGCCCCGCCWVEEERLLLGPVCMRMTAVLAPS